VKLDILPGGGNGRENANGTGIVLGRIVPTLKEHALDDVGHREGLRAGDPFSLHPERIKPGFALWMFPVYDKRLCRTEYSRIPYFWTGSAWKSFLCWPAESAGRTDGWSLAAWKPADHGIVLRQLQRPMIA
jgi:hypothetical protein